VILILHTDVDATHIDRVTPSESPGDSKWLRYHRSS